MMVLLSDMCCGVETVRVVPLLAGVELARLASRDGGGTSATRRGQAGGGMLLLSQGLGDSYDCCAIFEKKKEGKKGAFEHAPFLLSASCSSLSGKQEKKERMRFTYHPYCRQSQAKIRFDRIIHAAGARE